MTEMEQDTTKNKVIVLRLGHRPARDKRVSTHLLLAARAFGADSAYYTGVKDISLEYSITKIVNDWGGSFNVTHSDSWKKIIKSWNGKKVHLSMYGLPIQENIDEIRSDPSSKLVIVGGEKVPSEIYSSVDWNIAITSQPHSEVSALAVFLLMLKGNCILKSGFQNARIKVIPQSKGKKLNLIKKKQQLI